MQETTLAADTAIAVSRFDYGRGIDLESNSSTMATAQVSCHEPASLVQTATLLFEGTA